MRSSLRVSKPGMVCEVSVGAQAHLVPVCINSGLNLRKIWVSVWSLMAQWSSECLEMAGDGSAYGGGCPPAVGGRSYVVKIELGSLSPMIPAGAMS